MKDKIEETVEKIRKRLGDHDKLSRLLVLEKSRRGVDKDKLVFVGMANIANYYWCAMKSLLRSRKNELEFFGTYLFDRILLSFELRLIDKLPKKDEELLKIGDGITYSDVEKVLKERAKEMKSHVDAVIEATEITSKSGEKIIVINPALSPKEKELVEEWARSRGTRITDSADSVESRFAIGEMVETVKAEKYPTIRWNFEWSGYVVVGIPDGITESFVYEFKTVKKRGYLSFIKPVAFAQADLYAYFFKRPRKRVQIYIIEEDIVETFDEEAKTENAVKTLQKFKDVDEGSTPIAPKEWKCKRCEFRGECKLKKATF